MNTYNVSFLVWHFSCTGIGGEWHNISDQPCTFSCRAGCEVYVLFAHCIQRTKQSKKPSMHDDVYVNTDTHTLRVSHTRHINTLTVATIQELTALFNYHNVI